MRSSFFMEIAMMHQLRDLPYFLNFMALRSAHPRQFSCAFTRMVH